MGPQPRQSGKLVLELGELDLEASFVGLGVEREDVQDEPAAVDDLDPQQLLERALLCRRQLVVGDEHVKTGFTPRRRQLLGLALADVPVGIDVAAVLPLGADDVGTGRGREVGELGERFLGGPAVLRPGIDGDEEGLLDRRFEVDQSAGHVPAGYRDRPWRAGDALGRAADHRSPEEVSDDRRALAQHQAHRR